MEGWMFMGGGKRGGMEISIELVENGWKDGIGYR